MNPDPSSTRSPANELWRQTLDQISTLFGRLIYLASLRDPANGRYVHDPLARLQGPDEAHRILTHCHQQIFAQWIASSLSDQKQDLEQYLAEAGGGIQALSNYREVVPPMARDVERRLYLTDLGTLLELLLAEREPAFGRRAASPRP